MNTTAPLPPKSIDLALFTNQSNPEILVSEASDLGLPVDCTKWLLKLDEDGGQGIYLKSENGYHLYELADIEINSDRDILAWHFVAGPNQLMLPALCVAIFND